MPSNLRPCTTAPLNPQKPSANKPAEHVAPAVVSVTAQSKVEKLKGLISAENLLSVKR